MNKHIGFAIIAGVLCAIGFMALIGLLTTFDTKSTPSVFEGVHHWLVYWFGVFVAILGTVLGGLEK